MTYDAFQTVHYSSPNLRLLVANNIFLLRPHRL